MATTKYLYVAKETNPIKLEIPSVFFDQHFKKKPTVFYVLISTDTFTVDTLTAADGTTVEVYGAGWQRACRALKLATGSHLEIESILEIGLAIRSFNTNGEPIFTGAEIPFSRYRFCVPIHDDNVDGLVIRSNFSSHVHEAAFETAVLRTCQTTWQVDVFCAENGEVLFYNDNWTQFFRSNNLGNGFHIVLEYASSETFKVSFYDPAGFELPGVINVSSDEKTGGLAIPVAVNLNASTTFEAILKKNKCQRE